MTKQEKSWVLYDVANSAFVLIIMTTLMPIFFKDIASQGIEPAVSTANWGFANALASLILAFLAPIMGTFADYKHFKKKFLSCFLGIGIFFTLLLTFVDEGEWPRCLLLFMFARIGFAGANLFYDAFLVDVTGKHWMNHVSTNAYVWGYVGSVIPFLMAMSMIFFGTSPENTIPMSSARAVFVLVALWWLSSFSIPILKNVRQKHYADLPADPFRQGFVQLLRTFGKIRDHKHVFLFLMAYFFYIDGVNTIITMSTAYGRDIGLGADTLILVILMIQVVAFPFTLLYGRLADRFSEKTMLFAGIGTYTLVTFFLPDLPTMQMKVSVFWVLAFFVPSALGRIQGLSRSFFGQLIPARHAAEFFGFYNVFGKFAAITRTFSDGNDRSRQWALPLWNTEHPCTVCFRRDYPDKSQ